jgi:YD repeat-containing protein
LTLNNECRYTISGYDGLGRLIVVNKGTTASAAATSGNTFAFDALSRVTSEVQSIAGGSAKTVAYAYDKAGNRLTLQHHGGGVSATYAYDSRDRCTQINHNGAFLAEYSWLGSALSRRDTTLDTAWPFRRASRGAKYLRQGQACDYPGSTKPKFKSDWQRDGLLRVTVWRTKSA